MKYSDRPDLCLSLGRILGQHLAERGIGDKHVLVPVPLHPQRLAARGYNQAGLLANAARTVTGSRVKPRWLRRVRDTPQQAALTASERQMNVRDAFECPSSTYGAQVVLIDDVITTGHTAAACIEVLSSRGVEVVALAALAIADLAAAGPTASASLPSTWT